MDLQRDDLLPPSGGRRDSRQSDADEEKALINVNLAHQARRRIPGSKSSSRRDSAAGFSLVESLIAICIIAFGLMIMCQMMFVSLGGSSLARSKGTAILAAQNRLELLADAYRQDPNGADLTTGNHGPTQVEVVNPVDDSKMNRFNVAWTVSAVPDPRAGKILKAKRVTVTVTPIGRGTTENSRVGLNKIVSVTGIFSQKTI